MAWIGGAIAGGGALLGGLASKSGKAPKFEVKKESTLTPEQRQLLDTLINQYQTGTGQGAPASTFTGSVETQPIPLENLSLTALEERVKAIAGGGSPLEQATQKQLMDIISSGGTPTGGQTFEDFFKSMVEQPLTRSYQDTYTDIGTRFGGNELFSSDRATADQRAKRDFLESLTSNRANLAQGERNKSLDNLMAALNLSTSNQGRTTSELGTIAQTAFGERQFNQDNAANLFKQFIAEQSLKQQALENQFRAIGTPAFENIASVGGGQTGIGPGLISAGGSILSSMFTSGMFNQPNRGGSASPYYTQPNRNTDPGYYPPGSIDPLTLQPRR